jgi:hypothetical protein
MLKNFLVAFVVLVVCLSGCKTFPKVGNLSTGINSGGKVSKIPVRNIPLVTYPAQPPAHFIYYIMVTEWKVRGAYPKVKVDVTCVDEPGKPVIFNISLIQRKETPRNFSSASINAVSSSAGPLSVSLEDISVLLVNPGEKLLRITSNINGDNIRGFLDAREITLRFTLDGVEYTAVPPRKFYAALEEVRKGVTYFN